MMTESPSYESVLEHKSSGIDLNTAATFHDRVLPATDVWRARETQTICIKIMEDEKKVIKPESIIVQSSRHTCKEIGPVLASLSLVKRADGSKIV